MFNNAFTFGSPGTSSPVITNCSFSGNTATNGNGAIGAEGGSGGNSVTLVNNSIFWNNGNEISNSGGSSVRLKHTIFDDGTANRTLVLPTNVIDDGNNKDSNPLFVDADGVDNTVGTMDDDLRLQFTPILSPAIDMGNNTLVTSTDVADLDKDGNTTEQTPFDLDCNRRIVGAFADMGAFEFPCAAEAGEISNSLSSNNLTICESTDPGFTFSAENEVIDPTYLYAFLLVNGSGNILQNNTTGDFDLAALAAGTYTVYGLSYANFNMPDNLAAYLAGKTISDIQTDDAGTVFCLELTTTPVNGQTVTITVNPKPTSTNSTATTCSDVALNVDLQARITNGLTSSFTWTVVDNPNVTGEANGSGDFITQTLTNTSGTDQVVVYTVTPTDEANDCTGNTFTITVTVNPEPVGSNGTAATCSEDALNVNLQDQITNGMTNVIFTYTVSSSNPANVQTAPNRTTASNAPITDTYVNNTGQDVTITYTVTPIGNNGCTGNTFTIIVTVDGFTPGTVGNNQNVCVTKKPATLTTITPASSSATITYKWEMSTTGCNGTFTEITDGVESDAAENLVFTKPLKKTSYFRRRAFSTRNGLQCEAVSNCVTITVLNVDCGQFPWNGNE